MSPASEENPRTGASTSVIDEGGSPPEAARRRRRRRWGVAGAAAVVAAGVGIGTFVAFQPGDPEPVVQPPDPTVSPPAPWLSGASGDGVVTGEFGEWRGRPLEITGTWVDNNEAMVSMWPLQDGEEFGDWERPLDIAIGAIGDDETWEEAAEGEYDDRWEESLTELRELRADLPGQVYIRFAHEMNGNWYPWSVNSENHEAFVEAWQRFREMQQEIYPEAQLVFCVNRESVGTDMDWREFFPGARYVDVMAVDYYNQNPSVDSVEEWNDSLDETDDFGAPKGLQGHLDFARSVGLPLAVPEWSGNAEEGDSPAFIEGMYEFFDTHGGDGPGEVRYEILFNVDKDDRQWLLFDRYTRMPESAEVYQDLW